MRILRTAAVFILGFVSATLSQDNEILRAMQEEMDRSMAGLRMENQPPPYYIAYTIQETASSTLRASMGALIEQHTGRGRMLRVEVRVGSYDFDSSRFLSFEREAGVVPMYAQGGMICSLDDNYDVLRRQIWVATDAAYKRAVQAFSKKKAAFQNRVVTEPIPDFSRENPSQTLLPTPAPSPLGRDWPESIRQISAVFAQMPEIYSSETSMGVVQGRRYFLSSEGFKIVTPIRSASLRVLAETQAEDGMALRDFFTVLGNTQQDLPAVSELLARTRELAENLVALRRAPLGEDFSGPVLFEGQASSELLAQTLVPLFLSQRPMDADNPSMVRMSQFQVTPLLTRIGSRVLPDSFSISDTPSFIQYGNAPVPGSYSVDDEGVKAQDVMLVKDGKLQTLLTSRTPQKNLLKSNGHARGGSAQAAVFQVQTSSGIPASQLKGKYLELLKQQNRAFGYIIRGLANPSAMQSSSIDSEDFASMAMSMSGAGAGRIGPQILRAVKITLDGKEEPVRGLYLGNVSHSAFKDILNASEERSLYSCRPLPGGAFFGGFIVAEQSGSLVSLISPTHLMFEDLEVQRGKEVQQKLPIVPSPIR